MKTLIILSAFLLALSSCSKEMPVPDPDPSSVYTPDPDPVYTSDPDPDPDPNPDADPGYDDPSTCSYSSHRGTTIAWKTAASIH